MFHHYDDDQFKNIIDEFILASMNDKEFSYLIKTIDQLAIKLEITFYQMMFILIQKESIDNRKKSKKRGLSKILK